MAVHLRILFIVTGLAGIHSITTVSKVSVKAGGSISIPCLYDRNYINNAKYLCKGNSWNYCSYAVKTNGPSSGKFSISDDKKQRIFTVTINNLTCQDTGCYWCAVEINSGVDHGKSFHLSVTRDTPALYEDGQEITGFVGGEITIKCYKRHPGEIKWCGLGGSCLTRSSGSIEVNRVTTDPNVFTVTMRGLEKKDSGWYLCSQGDFQMPVQITVTDKPPTINATVAATTLLTITPEPGSLTTTGVADKETTTVQGEQQSDSISLMSFIILLSLLIFSVLVTLFIWFMLRKCKQAKAAASALTTTSHTEIDTDVMYSSVVFKKTKRVRKVEANDENVTYSTVA